MDAVPRRRFLQLAAVAVAAGAATLTANPVRAYATDAFDALRATWTTLLTGGAINPADPALATALATLNTTVTGYWNTIAPNAGAGTLWPGLPLSNSGNMTTSYKQLAAMATAYATPGSTATDGSGRALYRSAALGAAVVGGLDFVAAQAYTATASEIGNWWDWEIGSPKAMLNAALLVQPLLSTAQIASYTAAVDHFVPDPTLNMQGTSRAASTGANRVDLCQAVALRGILGKDSERISTAAGALSGVFPYVTGGDGLYADGSYVQHTHVPYTGTYGMVLLLDLAGLFQLLDGSAWAVTDPAAANIYSSVTSAFAPWVWNGLCLDAVRGRAVSRIQESDLYDGGVITQAVLQLALSAPAGQAADFNGIAKGWITADNGYAPYYGTASVPAIAGAEPVMADSSVPATPEPDGLGLFPGMDRVVHRRPGWAYAIALSSARTSTYESMNGENLHGWHTGDGMGYLYLATDLPQFTDSFWPTADPYRLPGTTVDTLTLANAAGTGHLSPATWAGGAAVPGGFGCAGMDFRQYNSTLVAKKSWFLLDDTVFALGAGITGGSGADVVTTVENRNLHTDGGNRLTVNGTVQTVQPGATADWSATLPATGWAQLDGVGGYLFPGGATVQATRTDRTGAWSDVNTGGPTTAITRPYLFLGLDHGTAPSNASYAYALLPGFTAAQTAARSGQPTVTVLANTGSVQAVRCDRLGLMAANFFAAGTVAGITVSAPCSVVLQQSGHRLDVAVADPTHLGTGVTVQIARGGTVLSADPTVTATAGSAQLTLAVNLNGTAGVTQHSAFTVTSTALPAVADSYVRDGSYAGTNYGSATTLVVKNAGTTASGYSRAAYLAFDTSALRGATVTSAVLQAYGFVSDSGGTQAAVTAYSVADTAWTESGLTWNTMPALGTALATTTATATPGWLSFDVTAHLPAPGRTTLALAEATAGLAVVLNSNNATSNPPRLVITTT
ncbi:polysaccharide lyase family 8 super-sandwich domain-containing protein [Streptacidiphilus sp. N1-12]|uniref:Polysaccharide lyase family 8 super-sandwich domain-containing protein n=2 Tax=Streptacidiphilus alkalitolerans TaxID=3342712 RepID=A0ABV6WGE6_9ACTN